MITKNNRFQCDICGKFIGYSKPFYSWTPFGNSTQQDPPEDEHGHKECYDNLSAKQKLLYQQTSWIKPHSVNG